MDIVHKLRGHHVRIIPLGGKVMNTNRLFDCTRSWVGLLLAAFLLASGCEGDDGALHFDWGVRIVEPLRQNRELPDLWSLFRSLRQVPVLAIRGGISDVLTADTFDRMAVAHPRLERLCLDGVGHVPSLFEPESTTALDTFLAHL